MTEWNYLTTKTYRGRLRNNGLWVFGDLAYWDGEHPQARILKAPNLDIFVDPKTVGVDTELRDSYGQVIYQDDIILTFHPTNPSHKVYGIVEWNRIPQYCDDGWCAVWERVINGYVTPIQQSLERMFDNDYVVIVIGNRFDDPNLMPYITKEGKRL